MKRAILPWFIGAVIYITARFIPGAAEYVYARGLYRAYSWVMSHLTGALGFSLGEILLITVPLLLVILLIIGIRRSFRAPKGQKLRRLGRLVSAVLAVTGVIFTWYMVACGTNYYRSEYAVFSGLEIRESGKEELYGLCSYLLEETSKARKVLTAGQESGAVPYTSAYTPGQLAEEAAAAMTSLGERIDVLGGYYPRPKAVFFSRTMSRFGIVGVYFPWTGEANVNVDVSDYSIGASMCHELSHVRGFMREDEANYIAYLASTSSDCPELRYSGYMLALIHSTNRLYEQDPELYRSLRWDSGIVADLRANSEYWDEFEDTVLDEAGEKMNNAYLKANAQEDGTKSYGRMVDLLLAEYRARQIS